MTDNQISPDYIPEEYRTPYDVLELPSQGILYENNIKTVKVEYLTAMDESILTSPNISSGGKMIDILLKRKIKDLNFNVEDLLVGDRTAIILFLRVTSFGPEYRQMIFNPNEGEFVECTIDLSSLKQKKLLVKPDDKGEFEFTLPKTNKRVTFTLLTGKDEEIIEFKEKEEEKRNNEGVSNRLMFKLEQQVKSIDGERDKIRISNTLKKLPIIDSRSLRKYIDNITPGMDFKTQGRTQGGESLETFLRFGSNFFWPEL